MVVVVVSVGKAGVVFVVLVLFRLSGPVASLNARLSPYIRNKNSMADSTSPPDASSARRFRLLSEKPISRNDANCVSNRSSGGCVGTAGVAAAVAAADAKEAVGVLEGCATGGYPPNLIRSKENIARTVRKTTIRPR